MNWILKLISVYLLLPTLAYAGCRSSNSQFEDISNLRQTVALVTEENRTVRTSADAEKFAALSLESVQGRFWCKIKGKSPKAGFLPTQATKQELIDQRYAVENATVMFAKDAVLVSRHMFVGPEGQPIARPQNCFFEHILTGEFYRVTQAYYEPLEKHNGKVVNYFEKDLALATLDRSIEKVTPIRAKDMIINAAIPNQTQLTVVSNYAANSPTKDKQSLTIANCSLIEHFRLDNAGTQSKIVGTDCNTGLGSSMAQIYVNDNEVPKFAGVAVSDFVKAPEGTGYQTNTLSTNVLTFTDDILKLRDRLPEKSLIQADK